MKKTKAKKGLEKKVFFAHPHPKVHFTYQEMLFNPPAGYRFVNAGRFDKDYASVAGITSGGRGLIARSTSCILSILSYLPIPTYTRVKMTRADSVPRTDSAGAAGATSAADAEPDLVYAAQCIPLTKKPWVLDVEFPEGVARFHPRLFRCRLLRWLVRRALRKPNCKGVVFWSQAARDGFVKAIGEDLFVGEGSVGEGKKHGKGRGDVESRQVKETIIRPGISTSPKDTLAKRGKQPLLLFVGRDFLRKGGLEAITAFERLVKKRKHSKARFVVVSDVPESVDKSKYPHVEFLPKLDREVLMKEYFPNASIYFMPSWHDTIVLVWLEAMRFGVPIVGLKDYASQEVLSTCGILADSYTKQWFDADGLTNLKLASVEKLVASHETPQGKKEFNRIVRDLEKALDKLLSDERLRRKLGAKGRELVVNGEFSIAQKRKKLKEFFDGALRQV